MPGWSGIVESGTAVYRSNLRPPRKLHDTLQNLDNTYTQQMLALQQAQAEAAAKAASRSYSSGGGNSSVSTSQGDISNSGRAWMYKMDQNRKNNKFTQQMSEEDQKAEIQYAISSAYQQGMLSRADAERIAAIYGL